MAIKIYEQDQTNSYLDLANTDVVYVPGFSKAPLINDKEEFSNLKKYAIGALVKRTSGSVVKYYECIVAVTTPGEWKDSDWLEISFTPSDTAYARPNIPTLCTSITEFVNAFGDKPALFKADQSYDNISSCAFDEAATAGFSNKNWFKANTPDPSYIYAKELIFAGIPVVYERLNGDYYGEEYDTSSTNEKLGVNVKSLYYSLFNKIYISIPENESELDTVDLPLITDKNTYTIKYLTTGGYPNFEAIYSLNHLADRMAAMAKLRGDCISLIDPVDNNYRVLTGDGSVIKSVRTATSASGGRKLKSGYGNVAAMIYPWCEIKENYNYSTDLFTDTGARFLPGSFAYLSSLAKSIKNNPNWYAVAGVVRGVIPNLISIHHNSTITNRLAELYQANDKVSINPIEFVRDSGYCIMGNRTMAENSDGCTVLSYLSNRNATNDIKREAFRVCNILKFELNTDILWSNFKAEMRPLLDRMVSGSGLKGYTFIKNTLDPKTGGAIPETKISATIRVQPVYAVEDFDIYVQLTDDDVVEVE